MAYTAEQLKNIRLAQKVGSKVGATRREQKAAIEAELVESNAKNLRYGDRDSVGILQQRPSQGWAHASDPEGALKDFYAHARQYRGQGLPAGRLAQAVQRSAFPDRYGQRAGEAKALMRGVRTPAAGTTLPDSPSVPPPSAAPAADPRARKSLLLSYLADRDNPTALLSLAQGLKGLEQSSPTAISSSAQPSSRVSRKPASSAGVVQFDGKPVRSDFAKQLAWARDHGWTGTVTSGYRTQKEQMAAAKRFGLQHYGPNGPLGSNHVVGHQGAVDVSDPDTLDQVLKKYPGKRTLRRGMADDPVHFSPTGH